MFQWLKKIIYKKEEKVLPETLPKEEIPVISTPVVSVESIPKEKKEIKRTVVLDNSQYGKIVSRLDQLNNVITSDVAKEKTLVEHDQRISLAISEITPGILKEIDSLERQIENLKTKQTERSPSEDLLIQQTEQSVSMVRKILIEDEVYKVVYRMHLGTKGAFAHELEKILVKSENNPRGIISKRTMFRALDKLQKKDKITKTGYGKYTRYVPMDLLSPEQREIVGSVKRSENT